MKELVTAYTNCFQRIIDDILTVSKLDSSMLAVTPVLVEPSVLIQNVVHMFEAELCANDILISHAADQSYYNLKVSWVHCDPSRVLQILVNLLTNAIKFTKNADQRKISIRLGASVETPATNVIDLQWVPSGVPRTISPPEQDAGDEVYLLFRVQDTGKGISADEMSQLYNRFAQASRKTHVQVCFPVTSIVMYAANMLET